MTANTSNNGCGFGAWVVTIASVIGDDLAPEVGA
jgi:hypothetical protein